MKRSFLLLPIFVFCLSTRAYATLPLSVDGLAYIDVNGSKQCILIRCSDPSNAVLLYLHGGPGESLIPFAHVATSTLTDRFTIVYWDQRGTGLSYAAADPPQTINVTQLIDDTVFITDYLRNRFGKEKIFLLGHSWGSTLGTLAVQKCPYKYAAYVGVGQVVSQSSLNQGRRIWLTKTIRFLVDTEDLEAIQQMDQSADVSGYYVRKYHGLIHNLTDGQLRQIMLSSPYSAEKYTPKLYDQGYELSWGRLRPEVKSIDLKEIASDIPIPVYFFLGKYDYCTPTAPVISYFEKLRAPHKEIVWFENSGHRMDVEEPAKFQQELVKKLLE